MRLRVINHLVGIRPCLCGSDPLGMRAVVISEGLFFGDLSMLSLSQVGLWTSSSLAVTSLSSADERRLTLRRDGDASRHLCWHSMNVEQGMMMKIIVGYLAFDGVMAVLFWWFTANDFKGIDSRSTKAEKRLDRGTDDWFHAQRGFSGAGNQEQPQA